MQTRSTRSDHHHQGSALNEKPASSCLEAELIALARSKGQVLAEHSLRIVLEALELRGVALRDFVEDVRPHFRNNILNPSGFLINRARQFHRLSRPASTPAPVQSAAMNLCGMCKGQKYVISENAVEPCPECSTPEFQKEWEAKQAERERKLKGETSPRMSG
jgi:hypothetical protein